MNFRRQQRIGWAVLGSLIVAGVAWLARLDFSRKISTDVLDLIPVAERSPEITLVRALASETEARTMLFTIETPAADGADAGELAIAFAARLATESAFTQAVALNDPAWRDTLAKEVFVRRFDLVFPGWLAQRRAEFAATGRPAAEFAPWLVEATAAGLNGFIAKPEAVAFQDAIPADPLLLMPGVAEQLKGALVFAPIEKRTGLVWARLAAPPLTQQGQGPAFEAIDRATAGLRARAPGVVVTDTGVNRFAAVSRAKIEGEVGRLNVLSVAAVFAVVLLFVRAIHRAAHLIPVVFLSVLGAWVVSTAVFERLHMFVFIVGSLLTGVAIDYGFYLFMQPPLTPAEPYWEKVRRLLKPLCASCLTTVAGFALLLFSDLPVIRQLGVFVGSGLICALGAALMYFSTVRDPFLPARTLRSGTVLPAGSRRWLRGAWIVAAIAALAGLARLSWHDDIRELEIPAPELRQRDAEVRSRFGDRGHREVLLTYGETIEDARARLDSVNDWLRRRHAAAASLAPIVPTAAAYLAATEFRRAQPDFAERLVAGLAAAGFERDAFQPFVAAYATWANGDGTSDLASAVHALSTKLAGPLSLLLHAEGRTKWFVTLVEGRLTEPPPPELHTIAANQLETLNTVFARYRHSALWLSVIGLATVGVGVLGSYGVRDGARIFAIPLGACVVVFGAFGWAGYPLNLFHLLGAFLGVCLTHNYSIFTATSAYRHEPTPVSVRLSALTTAASFGVLAISGIPVVRALGLTVTLMVMTALVLIELEHLRPLARSSHEG